MISIEGSAMLGCLAGFHLKPEEQLLIVGVILGWGMIAVLAPLNLTLSLWPPKGVPDRVRYRVVQLLLCAIGVGATALLFLGATRDLLGRKLAFGLVWGIPLYALVHTILLVSLRVRYKKARAESGAASPPPLTPAA